MSLLSMLASRSAISPVVGAPPAGMTWPDRVAAVGTPVRWCRFVNVNGNVLTMEVGADGTITNPDEYALGSLLVNSAGGNGMGFSGVFPDPTYATIATVESAQFTVIAVLQLDRGVGAKNFIMQVNSGAGVAGGAELSLADDGVGGRTFRFESADSLGARVVTLGGQAPIGNAAILGFVRDAADLLCYANGQPQAMSVISGALAEWPAPAAGTTNIGAFAAGGGSSGGIDCIWSEFLIFDFAMPPEAHAFLALHQLQDIVAARAFAGSVDEGAGAKSFQTTFQTHPALGVISITSAPAAGSAAVDETAIVYTPPVSVDEDTPDPLTYRNSFGGQMVDAIFTPTIHDVSTPPPPASALPEDDPLPAATATLNATTATLANVYASAAAGNHIVLANGSYGSRNLNRSFPSGNRLVIRAQNLHGAIFTSLTISGDGQIVSGVDINAGASVSTGHRLRTEGSNIRFTRGRVRNGGYLLVVGAGATDILVDHTQFHRSGDRMFYCDDPLNQQRITVARCWCHELLNAGAIPSNSLMFAWADENIYREKNPRVVVRLSYIGPGTAPGATATDFIHQKSSGALYAFNRLEGGVFVSFRNGMNCRMVGCYFPGSPMNVWDDGHWLFGNVLGDVKCPAGISAYYDTTKSLITSNQGGFCATTRFRAAGNQMAALRLGWDFGNNQFCTRSDGPLPDAQPAGGAIGGGGKPARSHLDINYAAFPQGDGLSIRAHSGPISIDTGMSCLNPQAVNVSSLPLQAAPASWLTDLVAQYPWIDDICPNPTSLTGGPGGSAPWSVAQALTRGDAATPTTGPFRDSAGGLP